MPPMLQHRFAIELFTLEPKRALAQVPLTGDLWGPAVECARFDAVRSGRRQALAAATPEVVEPVWHETLGQPYVSGFRLVGEVDSGHTEPLHQFDADYFSAAAKAAARTLLKEGRLEAGQTYGYLTCAYDEPVAAPRHTGSKFAVKTVPQPLGLRTNCLSDLLSHACPQGTILETETPVFVPQHVLDEAVDLLDRAGAAETGGVLIGYLHVDPTIPNGVFAEVTAQVPARHAVQELTALTFTAETWTSVDNALKLRNRGERKLGWWHSHPARKWCEKCPVENRAACPRSGDFFSDQDEALHGTVFPAAFSVGLVISDSYAHGLTFPMFGWREGRIEERGFYVTGGNGTPTRRTQIVEEADVDVPACTHASQSL